MNIKLKSKQLIYSFFVLKVNCKTEQEKIPMYVGIFLNLLNSVVATISILYC